MEEKLPEIYTEEVHDILSKPPSGIIRNGVTLIGIVIILLLAGSWFIKYPDKVTAAIKVSTSQVPASLIAKTSGKITHLFVVNNQLVQTNEILAVIENNAEYSHILLVDSLMSSFDVNNDTMLGSISVQPALLLGDLQSDFSQFQKVVSDYLLFKSLNLISKKITALQKQLSLTEQYYKRLSDQSNLQGEDFQIAQNEFRRDSILFSQKVLSAAEFDKSRASLIQRKQSYMSSRTNLSSTQIQKAQIEQQIVEMQLQQADESKQYIQSIQQSQKTLSNSINIWKNTYLIQSPIDGKVTFTNTREVNQNVASGDVVMTVVPEKKSELVGTIVLPMQGAGKVKAGQRINIKFDNYPYMEFGMVKAEVKSISLVTMESDYIVEVRFPAGLQTNYDRELNFSQEMSGSAEIITEDLRLIERFLNPIKSIIKNQ
ncbi:MAG: HlyD family secretion protein [Bacteroidales bacterium]